ncbi:MAG: hypothetical protein LBI39_04255 [Puniceicoccales bacterium]|nr:hypothetical protein [Puniceicoccales bacterium]
MSVDSNSAMLAGPLNAVSEYLLAPFIVSAVTQHLVAAELVRTDAIADALGGAIRFGSSALGKVLFALICVITAGIMAIVCAVIARARLSDDMVQKYAALYCDLAARNSAAEVGQTTASGPLLASEGEGDATAKSTERSKLLPQPSTAPANAGASAPVNAAAAQLKVSTKKTVGAAKISPPPPSQPVSPASAPQGAAGQSVVPPPPPPPPPPPWHLNPPVQIPAGSAAVTPPSPLPAVVPPPAPPSVQPVEEVFTDVAIVVNNDSEPGEEPAAPVQLVDSGRERGEIDDFVNKIQDLPTYVGALFERGVHGISLPGGLKSLLSRFVDETKTPEGKVEYRKGDRICLYNESDIFIVGEGGRLEIELHGLRLKIAALACYVGINGEGGVSRRFTVSSYFGWLRMYLSLYYDEDGIRSKINAIAPTERVLASSIFSPRDGIANEIGRALMFDSSKGSVVKQLDVRYVSSGTPDGEQPTGSNRPMTLSSLIAILALRLAFRTDYSKEGVECESFAKEQSENPTKLFLKIANLISGKYSVAATCDDVRIGYFVGAEADGEVAINPGSVVCQQRFRGENGGSVSLKIMRNSCDDSSDPGGDGTANISGSGLSQIEEHFAKMLLRADYKLSLAGSSSLPIAALHEVFEAFGAGSLQYTPTVAPTDAEERPMSTEESKALAALKEYDAKIAKLKSEIASTKSFIELSLGANGLGDYVSKFSDNVELASKGLDDELKQLRRRREDLEREKGEARSRSEAIEDKLRNPANGASSDSGWVGSFTADELNSLDWEGFKSPADVGISGKLKALFAEIETLGQGVAEREREICEIGQMITAADLRVTNYAEYRKIHKKLLAFEADLGGLETNSREDLVAAIEKARRDAVPYVRFPNCNGRKEWALLDDETKEMIFAKNMAVPAAAGEWEEDSEEGILVGVANGILTSIAGLSPKKIKECTIKLIEDKDRTTFDENMGQLCGRTSGGCDLSKMQRLAERFENESWKTFREFRLPICDGADPNSDPMDAYVLDWVNNDGVAGSVTAADVFGYCFAADDGVNWVNIYRYIVVLLRNVARTDGKCKCAERGPLLYGLLCLWFNVDGAREMILGKGGDVDLQADQNALRSTHALPPATENYWPWVKRRVLKGVNIRDAVEGLHFDEDISEDRSRFTVTSFAMNFEMHPMWPGGRREACLARMFFLSAFGGISQGEGDPLDHLKWIAKAVSARDDEKAGTVGMRPQLAFGGSTGECERDVDGDITCCGERCCHIAVDEKDVDCLREACLRRDEIERRCHKSSLFSALWWLEVGLGEAAERGAFPAHLVPHVSPRSGAAIDPAPSGGGPEKVCLWRETAAGEFEEASSADEGAIYRFLVGILVRCEREGIPLPGHARELLNIAMGEASRAGAIG